MEDELAEAGEDDEECDDDVGLHVVPFPRGQAAHKNNWRFVLKIRGIYLTSTKVPSTIDFVLYGIHFQYRRLFEFKSLMMYIVVQ